MVTKLGIGKEFAAKSGESTKDYIARLDTTLATVVGKGALRAQVAKLLGAGVAEARVGAAYERLLLAFAKAGLEENT